MYFPLIERRTSSEDRRAGGWDRRRKRRSVAGENLVNVNPDRRTGKERRVLQLDRETLLYGTLFAKDTQPNPEEKKSKSVTICSLILVPLTIAVTSALVTHFINEKQLESAKIIANQQSVSAEVIAAGQRENAIKIANANIENSKTIASAQMETQHLEHMVSIFSGIISPKDDEG